MNLQEVFDQLTHGEFSQLSIGGAAVGVLDSTNYAKVIGHVNLGLTALFTRFNLKERRTRFPLQSDADTYQLNVSDILKIEQIITDPDYEIALNKSDDIYSCFTPTLNTLRVPAVILAQGPDLPEELVTTHLTAVYRCNHAKIELPVGAFTPSTVELELPYSHLSALLFFVASRVHTPVGMSNEFHAGNSYYAKYEAECARLESKGIQVDNDNSNTRLSRGGWA